MGEILPPIRCVCRHLIVVCYQQPCNSKTHLSDGDYPNSVEAFRHVDVTTGVVFGYPNGLSYWFGRGRLSDRMPSCARLRELLPSNLGHVNWWFRGRNCFTDLTACYVGE